MERPQTDRQLPAVDRGRTRAVHTRRKRHAAGIRRRPGTTRLHELDRRNTGRTQSVCNRGHRQHHARNMRAMPQTRMAADLECRRRQIPAAWRAPPRLHAHQRHRSLRTKRVRTHVRHDVGHHEKPAHLRRRQPERRMAGRRPRHQPRRQNRAHHRHRRHRIAFRTPMQERRHVDHRHPPQPHRRSAGHRPHGRIRIARRRAAIRRRDRHVRAIHAIHTPPAQRGTHRKTQNRRHRHQRGPR